MERKVVELPLAPKKSSSFARRRLCVRDDLSFKTSGARLKNRRARPKDLSARLLYSRARHEIVTHKGGDVCPL